MSIFKYSKVPTEENFKSTKEWFFLEQRVKNQRRKVSHKKSYLLFKYSIITLLLIVLGSFVYYQFEDYNIEENGVITKAKIVLVKKNMYRVDDYAPQWVTNYIVWFDFKTPHGRVSSSQQILLEEYDLYFKYEIKNSDSIQIKYNSKNPKQNKICKIIK